MSTTTDSTTPPAILPSPGRRTPPVRSFGPLLLRLHFYAGLLVAPFLLVAALTGLAYTFTPQMENVVYADELTVTETGAARPLAGADRRGPAPRTPDGDLTRYGRVQARPPPRSTSRRRSSTRNTCTPCTSTRTPARSPDS